MTQPDTLGRLQQELAQNANYWTDRFQKLEESLDKDLEGFKENAKKQYQESIKIIERQIKEFYLRFANLENINYQEAQKLLNSEELKAFKMSLEEYIDLGHSLETTYDPAVVKTMEEASLRVRVSRVEAVKYELEGELAKLASSQQLNMFASLAYVYEDRYYKTLYTFDNGTGNLGVSFSGIDEKQIMYALERPWAADGVNFSTRIWNNQKKLKQNLDNIITQGIMTGDSYDNMIAKLERAMGTAYNNAATIIVTEASAIASRAQHDTFDELDVEKYVIRAVLDRATSQICQMLDGKEFLEKDYEVGVTAPPFHPNCVLPDTKIASPDGEALTKSWYSGDVIELITSKGRRLSVTPNHIMLTSRGWVRAKNLVKGDKVIYYNGWDEFVIPSDPTDNHSIPTIEDLFAACVETGISFTTTMPATAVDFKGDVIENSEIDIVSIDSFLRDKLNPSFIKFVSDQPLIYTGEFGKRTFPGKCTLSDFLIGASLASDGVMSSFRIASILFGRSFRHHELVRFLDSSQYNARLFKTISDNRFRNFVFFGQFFDAYSGIIKIHNFVNGQVFSSISRCNPGFSKDFSHTISPTIITFSDFTDAFSAIVELDEIVDFRISKYSGHVYDISSLSTLYIANGFLSSNCRSSTAPKFDEDDFEERIARLPNEKGDWKSTYVEYMTYEEWADKYNVKPWYGRPKPGAKIELVEKDGKKHLKVTNPKKKTDQSKS